MTTAQSMVAEDARKVARGQFSYYHQVMAKSAAAKGSTAMHSGTQEKARTPSRKTSNKR